MRNWKIGTRIFAAFGAVIAMMLVTVAVVFTSNMGIIGNVDKISVDSRLQTAGNKLKDNFLLTRVVAVRVLFTTDAEVFEDLVRQADLATQNFSEIHDIVDQNEELAEFRSLFTQAEADFNAYVAKIAELGRTNEDERTQIDKMNAAGASIAQSSDLIFRDQLQLLRNDIASGTATADAQSRRANLLQTGFEITQSISSFRIFAREMMASFDSSHMTQALESLDHAYALTEEYNKTSTIPDMQQNSRALMDDISEYRDALVEFGAVCDHAALVSDDLTSLGETSLASLSAAVDALDAAMADQVQSTKSSATSALVIVMGLSLLSILIAIALSILIRRGITVPVSKMVRAADALALGETDVDVRYESKDEIGSLAASFEKMTTEIAAQVSAVERLADGDLTVRVRPRSDKDKMGYGLQKMVDSLNNMFFDVNRASHQVSAGSKQIADGAQSLAQGSTEQASAVEELSSSISQVASKTKDNADMASKAAELALAIKQNAEKGSVQMTQMMEAVAEINDASGQIGKVIKVIDDIAFQTNILALNAAVEAARAGQHGKGFAVVAEEVRNLAAKSSEAAKDTGALIANSMEKAEYGSRIAQETANSLADIVSGINESTRIVSDIARVSEEQSAAVAQINTGIDQVAQVVQQNSATAEESAAASEEMSNQSETLTRTIAQFKLKEASEGAPLSVGDRNQRRLSPLSEKASFASDAFGDSFENDKYMADSV